MKLQTYADYVSLTPGENYNILPGLPEDGKLVRKEGQYFPGRTYYQVLDSKGYPTPFEAFFDESQPPTSFFFHISPLPSYPDLFLLLI